MICPTRPYRGAGPTLVIRINNPQKQDNQEKGPGGVDDGPAGAFASQPDQKRTLWIDALCLNLEDPEGRKQQNCADLYMSKWIICLAEDRYDRRTK